MNLFDIKTAIVSYGISNVICTIVMAFLWFHNHKRFAGLGFWLAGSLVQLAGVVLVILRGLVPAFLSITVSYGLVIAGAILLQMGLEQFFGMRRRQTYNIILLSIFILLQSYFTVVYPRPEASTIILSLGVLGICSSCAWLLLRGVEVETRRITRSAGIVFSLYCILSIVHIMVGLASPSDENLYHLNVFNTAVILLYQMLLIALTFSLFLMVNRRLVVEFANGLDRHHEVEAALRLSEEKFYKAFQSSPDAILISRLWDGKIVDVNEGFSRLTGYSAAQALSGSSIALNLWVNQQDRETYTAALQKHQKIPETAYDFRARCGKILNCLISGQTIQVGGETHVLSVVRDVTERKQTEAVLLKLTAMEERQRLGRDLHDSVNQSIHSLVLFSETLVSTLEKDNTERAAQIADRMHESARQALKETRLLLYELQPAALEGSGNLIGDLEARLATVERRAGVRAQIVQEGSMEYCPVAWHENLFWIAVESLNNALKHAQARQMQIVIRCFPDHMDLEIVDDGIGFDPNKPHVGGLGLQTMRDRANLLGGTLTIESTPGKGSRVRFQAEIKESDG